MQKPRYKVIQDYPNAAHEKGTIIESTLLQATFFDRYPQIFKKLEFYQDVNKELLPNYVKFIWKGIIYEVCKVKQYLHQNNKPELPIDEFELVTEGKNKYRFPRVSLKNWQPATEEEYIDYQKEQLIWEECQCEVPEFTRTVDADYNPLCGRCGKKV